MEYSKLVETYQKLGETQSTLEKTSILAELYTEEKDSLEDIILLSMGRAFPAWKDLDLGISSKTMVDVIQQATGKSQSEIEDVWKDEGDLGLVVEKLMESGGGQQSLMQRELTVERVNQKLEKVAMMSQESLGSVSMDKKKKEVAALLNDATPEEAKYIVRTFIENLRLGVGEGIVRDALAETFFEGENAEKIQRGYDLTNDFTEVAEACKQGIDAVEALEIQVFKPIKSMLARKVDSIEEGFESVGKPAAIDYKYDGIRAQVHVKDGEVKVFTRRLDDVTKQFPDVVNAVKENIDTDNCIIDTELVAYDPESMSTIPFQQLSKRVKRKYDIQRLKQEIPVEVRPFDLIYLEGSMLDTEYQERWDRLIEIVDEEKWSLRLSNHKITDSAEEANQMEHEALEDGQEGIMMKNLEAVYKPGSRVGHMVKIKPTMETLDLTIIGGEWGEGRRSGWIGSLKLGCYDPENDKYLEIGKMATGLTDEQLEELTEKLEPLITEQDGREVKVRPEVIVEAEYEEIQKSPTYTSGYALRFPRLKSFREDKDEADSIEKVENLYDSQ